MGAGYYPFYQPTRRRPADGIRARSQRGAIGETWWSQRFIDVLESFNMQGRLTRGRSYARSGQVLELAVGPGEVKALVQGSRAKPYRVRIEVKTLSRKDWRRVEGAMAASALFIAKLLAGEMPADIEEAFEGCNLSLFPASKRELRTECTCPDWENPCKHIAAAYFILAEQFDEDPFLILAWRGRTKEELLEQLRSRRRPVRTEWGPRRSQPSPPKYSVGLVNCLDSYWALRSDLSELHLDPCAAGRPGSLLVELGAPPEEAGGAHLEAALANAYVAMARAAQGRASGSFELDERNA